MSRQVSSGSAGEYQADVPINTKSYSSLQQPRTDFYIGRQESRGSVAEYQANEQAGVAWLSLRG